MVAMNPGIILAGQAPDVIGSMARGAQAGQFVNEAQHQNALRAAIAQHGAGLVSGDAGARNVLAGFDPGMVMQADAHRQSMDHNEQRLQLAYQQAQRQAQELGHRMSQAERQQELERINRGIAMGTQAQTPEQWDQIMQSVGAAELVGQFENRNVIVAGALGVRDALSMGQDGGTQAFQTLHQRALAAGMQPGTPEYQRFMAEGSGPQTVVNVGDGAPGLGRLSPDYGYVLDPDTGQPVIDRETGLPQAAAVPGSPAWQERRDAEAAAQAGRRNAVDYARTVTQDIGIAEDFLSQLGPVSSMDGVMGANLRAARANVRGTPEWNMSGFVESALSNLTLDTMNRMRETSAAGATGMGNMSNQQLRVIQGVLGQWDPGLPIDEQRFILHRLGNFYMDVQVGTREERAQAVRDGRMTAEENQAIEALYYPETRDVRGRRIEGGQPQEQPAAPAQQPAAVQRLRFNPQTGQLEPVQ